MSKSTFAKCALVIAILLVVAARVMLSVAAQTQNPPTQRPGQTTQGPPGPGSPQRPGGPGGGGGGFGNAFPQKPQAAPEMIELGKALFSVQCSFCHGSDARGGEGGPSLIRSDVMLKDQKGELLAPVVLNGRGEMPKFSLTTEQISDIAAFIHSFRVSGYDAARNRPATIVVGEAKAGEEYFNATCAKCHSVTGDLKGFAAKFRDPRTMQQNWLIPGGGGGFGPRGGPSPIKLKPVTVTVTLAGGKIVEGTLNRIDDFLVTLTEEDGATRTIHRHGEAPKVEIHDPLEPHKKLLGSYTDKDIHNVTAYLESLK
ncbi:MAG: c-type cytochrome [Chloracidobacterium sp.]|nr:c-type cytochrome [Chloracidobacterium sp.]